MKKRSITPRTRTALITLGALLFLALLLFLGHIGTQTPVLSGPAAATQADRIQFLASCGWAADPATEELQQIRIPEVFSPVYQDYNELQRQQGYDLDDYRGRDCLLYSYTVTNWPDDTQTVLADLYVYKNRIIGGDIHSTNLNGFMIGLK